MLDIFAKLLSTVATFLFPVFASYKALKTSDPALLTPWLMYWVVLACCLLVESWTEWILVWVPFYAWIRAGFLLYLIAPQTQGARILYQVHVHPFLQEHEHTIDDFISSAHDRAKTTGLNYLRYFIELLKQHLLGLPPPQPTPPPPPTALSYTQSLIARFNLPSAGPSFPTGAKGLATSTATDFYSLLASAVSAATSGTAAASSSSFHPVGTHDLSNSGTLIPPTISGFDRATFISTQRERLSTLLSALDREAANLNSQSSSDSASTSGMRVPSMSLDGSGEEPLRPASAMGELSKSRSEVDFEKIENGGEEEENKIPSLSRQGSGGWLPWSWGAKATPPVQEGKGKGKEIASEQDKNVDASASAVDQGKSTGLDI